MDWQRQLALEWGIFYENKKWGGVNGDVIITLCKETANCIFIGMCLFKV